MIAFTKSETAFPTWAAVLVLAIPVSIIAFLLVRALVRRRRHARVTEGPLSRRVEGVPLGSSDRIVDGGQVPWENLLEALAVQPEAHGPGPGGEPWDEGWWATMLGLRSRISTSTTIAEPHILWGTRRGRQVFIRLGVDEVGEGLELLTNRGLRQIVVVRAALPTFELRGEHGRLTVTSGAGAVPAGVTAALAELDPAPDVWRDLQVVAGPDGVVTTRPQLDDGLNGWIYDLWLAERIADAAAAEPLLAERIGPAWKVPYGVAGKRRRRRA